MSGPGWHVQGAASAADEKGRRVLADRPFAAGAVVLSDDPYACAVVSEQLGSVCSCGCAQPLEQPLRCSACKLVCFASRDHQRYGWNAGHREECAALRAAAPRVPPTAVRLALRCVLRHWAAQQGAAGGAAAAAAPDRFGEVLSLQHHWERLQDGAKLLYAQMGALAHSLLGAASPGAAEKFTPRDMAQLIARYGANSHTVSDAELQPLAVGTFPLGAMVNHDCRPNTVHTFSGTRMVFRAIRDIQPGEEVATSYTELGATRWERRAALLQHHAFDIDTPPAAAGVAAGQQAEATEGGAAAGPAAVAAAGAVGGSLQAAQQAAQQAALQRLPAQPAAAVLSLPQAGAEPAGELHLCDSLLPPWPHDERDVELTAVLAPAGSGGGGSSSGSSGSNTRWSGMWGCLPAARGAASASAASESFGIDDELLETAAEHAALAAGGTGSRAGLAGGWQQGPAQAASSEGQRQAPIVHCWRAGGIQQAAAALDLAARYAAALRLAQLVDGLLSAGSAGTAVHQLRGALAALDGGSRVASSRGAAAASAATALVLGPRHILRLRLLAELHRAAIAAGQWEVALRAGQQLLPLYEFVYPAVWPQLGLLHASVAKLAHLLERPAEALAAAKAAARILSVTHGGGSAAEEARRVAAEAEAELAHGAALQRRALEDVADVDD
ncbi:hypothetical protein ABPG75_001693 [Micractinium tetrahymenae]